MWDRRVTGRHVGDAPDCAQQCRQRWGHGGDDTRATLREQRQIAHELQRVAKTLLVHYQHRAPGQVGLNRERWQQALAGKHAAARL